MSKITFTPPSPSAPGYLRRTRDALKFSRAIKNDPGPDVIDDLVKMLLPYVTEPTDRAEAEAALWDASQEQFQQLLAVFTGSLSETPQKA